MKDKILDIISSVSKLDKEYLNEKQNEQNLWESIVHVEIIIALEETFDISLTQKEIAEMKSVEDIIKIVKQKVQNEA